MSRWRWTTVLWAGGVTAASVLIGLHGCGNDDTVGPGSGPGPDASDGRADGEADVYRYPDRYDAGSDADAVDAGCVPYTVPADVPKGWEEYTDWSCNCRFYVPGSPEVMPPAIEWEPCPEAAPQQVDCRHMKPFWAQGTSAVTGVFSEFSDHPHLGPLLMFTRANFLPEVASPKGRMTVIAQVDGKALNGFFQRHSLHDGCHTKIKSLNEDVFTFSVIGAKWNVNEQVPYGGIGGKVGERPRVLRRLDDPGAASLFGSNRWLVEWFNSTMRVMDWDAAAPETIYPTPDTESNLPAVQVMHLGDDLFFEVNAGGQTGVFSWDATHGTRPLLRWHDDPDRGAGGLGTDGVSLVWGEGRTHLPPTGGYAFEQVDIMTAPYTTDPAELAVTARRLRSSQNSNVGLRGEEFRVGCGLAARATAAPCQLSVVRIDDGAAWFVPCAEPQQAWAWARVLGVTCEEVFVAVSERPNGNGTPNIARVRLDSLGEPVPAD
ncbi:MAG: hypothetical protein ACOC1F_00530 [Myxococcota bacterium]